MAAAPVVVQLRVEDADSAAADSLRVCVRCKQLAPFATSSNTNAKKKPRAPALQVDLIEGQALWSCELTEEHKPTVLDCSGAEYLRGLDAVFTHGNSTAQDSSGAPRAFVYKWSRKSGVLTLMETSDTGFAMKYTSIKFAPTDDRDAYWSAFTQEIVDMQAHAAQEIAQQRERIHELEMLLKAKDNALKTALEAKQRVEDQLFEGFCAVLNAKKDEIQRLQHELTVAQVHANDAESLVSAKPASKRKQKPKKPRQPRASTKAKGAKSKQKAKAKDDEDEHEDEDDENGEDNSASNSDDAADYDDGEESDLRDDSDEESDNEDAPRARRSRAKSEAANTYSQLPSTIRSSSQVCSANDVLSNLDTIMKQEVNANEDAMQYQNDTNGKKRPRPVTAPSTRRAQENKKRKALDDDVDVEETPKPEQQAAPPIVAAQLSPPKPSKPAKSIYSEEEDILDMLA
uniref:DNA repair protein XRCC4 n=1 Tax=Globisporangium ultimum (strain ATCC 200006 / CBS 805.95 / DAOM BR144) TaxID=431595 RepID=K3X9C9_GLOUD